MVNFLIFGLKTIMKMRKNKIKENLICLESFEMQVFLCG